MNCHSPPPIAALNADRAAVAGEAGLDLDRVIVAFAVLLEPVTAVIRVKLFVAREIIHVSEHRSPVSCNECRRIAPIHQIIAAFRVGNVVDPRLFNGAADRRAAVLRLRGEDAAFDDDGAVGQRVCRRRSADGGAVIVPRVIVIQHLAGIGVDRRVADLQRADVRRGGVVLDRQAGVVRHHDVRAVVSVGVVYLLIRVQLVLSREGHRQLAIVPDGDAFPQRGAVQRQSEGDAPAFALTVEDQLSLRRGADQAHRAGRQEGQLAALR